MNITHHKNGKIKTLVEEAPYHPGYEDAGFKPTTIKSSANELADELEQTLFESTRFEAATMLRQQQAEIAELKVMLGHYEDVYEGVVTHPVKELTDDEIGKLWHENQTQIGATWDGTIAFARAILRKAQEQ